MTTFIGALLIGLTLGLLGSGGSAITVPILVYFVGHDAKASIAESMAIVGIISLVGAIPKAINHLVSWSSVLWFGFPAMFGAYIGAWLGGLATDSTQLIVFGIVIISAAIFMMKNAFGASSDSDDSQTQTKTPRDLLGYGKVIGEGVLVGALTGFVGVGGGFLIVPSLLILEKLPIRTAIGTSLVIIAMKSAIGFAKYQYILADLGISVDVTSIFTFSLIGIAGCGIGTLLNKQLNQKTLKKVFAIFLVLIGAFVIYRESLTLFNRTDSQDQIEQRDIDSASQINSTKEKEPKGTEK